MKQLKYILATILVLPLLAHAANPVQIDFQEGQTKKVTLSNNNINHIVVRNDTIAHVQCPQGLCSANQYPDDQSGSVYLGVTPGKSFTMFLDTTKGRHVALQINSQAMAGQTIMLNPLDPGVAAKAWESSTPYDQMIISLMKGMVTGTTPDGYGQQILNQKVTTKTLDDIATFTLVQKYQGDALVGLIYQMQNITKKPLTLSPQAFYLPGVRAVALSQQTTQPNGMNTVYIIEDRGMQ